MNLRNILLHAIVIVLTLVLFACQKSSNNKEATLQTKVHESADGSQKNEDNKKSAESAPVLLGNLDADGTLQIDLNNTKINWIGRKVTGEHTGTLNLSKGWVVIDNNTLVSGKFIFDMTSISNTDIESPEWKQKLEDHLKAEDFFYVDSFPKAILEIKKNQPFSSNSSTSNNQVLADLTIRGVVHEINLPYVLIQDENYLIAKGTVNVDRTLYNIRYKSGKFIQDLGDKLIYDDFTVQFMIQTGGNKQ